jgi:hypothetical protein
MDGGLRVGSRVEIRRAGYADDDPNRNCHYVYAVRVRSDGHLEYWLLSYEQMTDEDYGGGAIRVQEPNRGEGEAEYEAIEELNDSFLAFKEVPGPLPDWWPMDGQGNIAHGPLPDWFPMDGYGFVLPDSDDDDVPDPRRKRHMTVHGSDDDDSDDDSDRGAKWEEYKRRRRRGR